MKMVLISSFFISEQKEASQGQSLGSIEELNVGRSEEEAEQKPSGIQRQL
jgi:hypothetical protein